MKRDEDPQLWDLLGHSKVADASPFFARDVLRQLREDPVRSGVSWLAWWREGRFALPAFAAVVAVVLATIAVRTWTAQSDQPRSVATQPGRVETIPTEVILPQTLPVEPVAPEQVAFTDAEKADLSLLVADVDEDDDSLLL